MSIWLVRSGKYGEYLQKFLNEGRIYLTWSGLNHNLASLPTRVELGDLLRSVYPDSSTGLIRNNTGQIWTFAKRMKVGDWIIAPNKNKASINVAEITGDYTHDLKASDPFFHHRAVNWIETDIPRTNFDKDLLFSFGAIMTICQIKRNDAEVRIRSMAKTKWKSSSSPVGPTTDDADQDEIEAEEFDLEQMAQDQIANLIIRKFKGHGLERLVEEILQAQGYTTYRSPAGPDKGIDILASPGPLGFGNPRLCVQVKSGDSPVDSPTVNQLIGSMQNVQADQGLFVSWAGFKSSVDRELPANFFRVRFWDQKTLIEQLLLHYDKLSADLRAELPLKQIWTAAVPDGES